MSESKSFKTETESVRSHKPPSKAGSSASIELLRAKAKAEAAQARASYAKREIEIKVEQARLQATLDALRAEQEKEAAIAEANSLEAGLLELGFETRSVAYGSSLSENKEKHTAQYVLEQTAINAAESTAPVKTEYKDPAPAFEEIAVKEGIKTNCAAAHNELYKPLSTSYKEFTPLVQTPYKSSCAHNEHAPSQPTYDLAKYLARSQLITTGLTSFDDQPMNYWAWKSSFKTAIAGLDLSPGEELDLLVRYLGKDSAKQAKQMRAVNIRCPEVGLAMTWDRLEEVYGSPEAVEQALFQKVDSFPRITLKEPYKLRDLADLMLELEAAKLDGYLPGLSYLDTSRGIQAIVEKLPYNLQEKWMNIGSKYKHDYGVSFPPFTVFVNFIRTEARTRTDPSFSVRSPNQPMTTERRHMHERFPKEPISVHKTQLQDKADTERSKCAVNPNKQCPIHNKPHPLKRCRGFREKPLEERKQILKKLNVCFRCCSSTDHLAKNCESEITCTECDSKNHISALHPGPAPQESKSPPSPQQGGESDKADTQEVTSRCTEVCGEGVSARECAKITLVNVYPAGHREQTKKMYAILDDQSNRSLARSQFFDVFQIQGESRPYMLKTCAGLTGVSGRSASGFVVESVNGNASLPLPTLLECNDIPDNRSEIPTPEAAHHHAHLRQIANLIPPLDPNADILLLLGRDMLRVHKVREQINGPDDAPFAQRLDMGWVVVGDVCLDGVHRPPHVNSYKTFILENGRASHFQPCSSQITVKETFTKAPELSHSPSSLHVSGCNVDSIGQQVFTRTADDHRLAPSLEDMQFLQIMDSEFYQGSDNSWVGPLPFRSPRQRLPNNRQLAYDRLMSLRRTLEKRPEMKTHFLEFMENMLTRGHAEVAPALSQNQECWYLPLFGVYHPKKPAKIRVVFDSSAPYEGVSLNDVLLTGPDLNNSLVGVLIRFRKEQVAITADIEHMFHCFVVKESHRDFLRFLWYKDNDMSSEVIEFRMRVHIFGNSPSPSVAIYGLKKAAATGEPDFGSEVRTFIERDFYVDDALKSFPTEERAIQVLQQAQQALASSNLRLHKVISNRPTVLEAFPPEDRAKNIGNLDLCAQDSPVQRSLGLLWNVNTDTFTFKVDNEQKAFTRRGVLSTVNSLYDPLGFLAPITIQGRLILRELTGLTDDWDATLPDNMKAEWSIWKDSLRDLEGLQIPRPYTSLSTSGAQTKTLCVFADASVKAIAAVAYIKLSTSNKTEIGFVFGKTKLAPQAGLTIPRLELCAAVLAVEVAELIVAEIDITFDDIEYYTDSKVVLGYIHNQSRRFYVYVHNRVQRILQSTCSNQWKHVPSELNPADYGSRSVAAAQLSSTTWFKGPAFKLHPILDSNGLLRVGGRIIQSELGIDTTHPLIIPARHHLGTLLIRHYHETVKHQGRHFTEGAIRAAGFWMVGAKRAISTVLFKCVTCKKLRGKAECQQMGNLPSERMQVAPPFTYVGVDVFGPWDIVTRRTRGGQASSKRWAVMFSCLSTRAVHIELIESMSTDSFINALRRLFAIRGPARQLRSDCGTNFIGASRELKMDGSNMSVKDVEGYLSKQNCSWIFNPPHASHMGGAWERMIGIARRILDSMLQDCKKALLTHELLSTFMGEVCAIINARPLIPVSTDPESPLILTPSMLLTMKPDSATPPPGDFGKGILLKEQWRRVQSLADMFWSKWRREYLHTLQLRHKWQDKKQSLKEGTSFCSKIFR
ncbi:tumor suppressor p53-binding protein 1 [Sarotherodon galilaeus]